VLIGDTAAELPRLVASARELLQNLAQLSAPDAALGTSLANLQVLTERAKGPRGALGAVLSEADGLKISAMLKNAGALLARLDGMAAKADTQVLGPEGLVPQGRATVVELAGLLADARASLKRVDAVLAEAQAVAGNVRSASTDLGALRGEVDATVRKVEQLVDEINRKWPFARDTELKLR